MTNFDSGARAIKEYIRLANKSISRYKQQSLYAYSKPSNNSTFQNAERYAEYARNALVDLTNDSEADNETKHTESINVLHEQIGFIYEELEEIKTDDEKKFVTNCAFIDSTLKN